MSKGDEMRAFESGATRNTDEGKNDYEGFLCPLVIESYGDYMTMHRKQADGKLRDSDNWRKGIPLDVYIKSLWRHFLDLCKLHRGYEVFKEGKSWTRKEVLNAILFNVMGYLHEILKEEEANKPPRQ